MDYRKKERELVRLDYVIVILSIVGLFIYTVLFMYLNNWKRYLFIGFDLVNLIFLYKASLNIILFYKAKKIKKYNRSRVNLKLFNRRRRRVKRAV